jgi:Zn-dependent protease
MHEHEHSGIRLGSILGSPLYVEPSFFILVVVFVFIDLQRGYPIERALLWAPTLFFSVIIHELGHAAMIGLLGFGRSLIALGGFGGMTVNDRTGRPWQNILISLAGPVAGCVFAIVLLFAFTRSTFLQTDRMMSNWFPLMIWVNFAWAIFNLLPIYPLDGGKILRSGTAWFMTNLRSFKITTWVSMVLALVLVVAGLAQRNYFTAAIAASLLLDNYQRWDRYKQSGFPE